MPTLALRCLTVAPSDSVAAETLQCCELLKEKPVPTYLRLGMMFYS